MAQFYAWYSTPLHPAIYTTPSRTQGPSPRTHARSRSEASSAPSPVDPPRTSSASTASSARESSSAGLTPQSSRTTQDQSPAADKGKLKKKRRARANPFRHARSSSADSALPPDGPASPTDDAAVREPPGLSARLLHRLHAPDPARRGPRDAGPRPAPRDPCPAPCPCRHLTRGQAADGIPSTAAAATHSSRPSISTGLPPASRATPSPADASPDGATPTRARRSVDAGPCCPSCCPSLAHPDPLPGPGAPTARPTPPHATRPSRARALGNADAAAHSASEPHSAPFRPHLQSAQPHSRDHDQDQNHATHDTQQQQHHHQHHRRRASRPRRRGLLAAHDTILPSFLPPTGPLELPPEQRKHAHQAQPSRPESLSSATASSLGARTMAPPPSDPSSSRETLASRPFAPRNGRTYLADPTLAYPLPVDLAELHRQSLRTLLLIQVFGAPACSPAHAARPPARVLEVGCGSGFWSMMCHRYFRDMGHPNIAFTGLDVAPLAPGAGVANGGSGTPRDVAKPDPEMNWRFVQHDIRQAPFPFSDGEFDLVMVKDMSLAVTHSIQQRVIDEYLRVLKKGGHLEIWDSDHTIRMLRPHAAAEPAPSGPPTPAGSSAASASSADHDEERRSAAAALGAYVMTANTPLSPPLNNYLVEYNSWLSRALEARDVSAVPCTLIGPLLLQESEELADVRSRRVAIPLSEVRWEREGVGGVVTKDGKSYIDTRGRGGGGALSGAQAALRRTALEIVVQGVQSLEPVLREVSGKRVDEWEGWIGKMAGDLLGEGGTSWGECLEVGAWWAQKR